MLKYLPITFLLIFLTHIACAMHYYVSSASDINGKKWTAGDTIVMKNGKWVDQTIVFKGIGTSLNPVFLMAQTPGEVILSGNSSLSFSGTFLEISGLWFKNGTLSGKDIISFRTSSTSSAENCSLKNTAIVSCNPSDRTIENKWVSMYGKNNTVSNCSFLNKTNMGTLLVVWLENDVVPNHTIENNYFGYRNANLDNTGKEINGQEIIRIGDSHTSMQTAGVKVTSNYFEDCNGETETISNKSCGNYYSNNIFVGCKGTLTLRHGNNCTVDGNYFIGNGIPGTGGVRIIGENHKVYNNYFQDLKGTDFRAAICMVRGKENSAPNEYFQVKNALVAFNTMVDCSQSLSINYNNSTCTMPPVGSVIACNVVYNTSANSESINVKIEKTKLAEMDVQWKNNFMNEGEYKNFTFSSAQVNTETNLKMKFGGSKVLIYEPSSGTGLSAYTTSEYPEITVDIRGRVRTSQKLPGASQVSGETSRFVPQKNLVGATFIKR
jgi:poly(beta-D-mannuronate) lyase